MAGWAGFFGAEMTRTPSEDRLEVTRSGTHPSGKVYFRTNWRETNLETIECYEPPSLVKEQNKIARFVSKNA